MKKTFAMMMATACCAAQAVTVKPENTDEILVNPDMGLVMFHYSNRQWAYGQLQERGDTLDWFPGVSTIYFRLPWCLLEPQEGHYRWDLFDSYAAPWIAAGKQIAFRVTCCESRYTYATPEWVKDAGAKGWFFKMKMAKIYGKVPPGSETDIWEPDYGDPVFLKKLENFLKAMARRYDGKPYVAFMDIGTIGMWGEGHTRAYGREMKAQGRDPEAAFHVHYDLHRRIFPRTTLLCIDDQAGSSNPLPAAEVPLMKHAHDLGFGFRDDSILVFTSSMIPERLKPHPWWFHANWADYFAPAAPVFVEHEHYNLSRDRGAWSDEKLVESVEAYHATWLSLHGWPKEIYENSKEAYARAARRIGYRFELREVDYPETVTLGQPAPRLRGRSWTTRAAWRGSPRTTPTTSPTPFPRQAARNTPSRVRPRARSAGLARFRRSMTACGCTRCTTRSATTPPTRACPRSRPARTRSAPPLANPTARPASPFPSRAARASATRSAASRYRNPNHSGTPPFATHCFCFGVEKMKFFKSAVKVQA